MYTGSFNLNPVSNNPAMPSYQPKPASTVYPGAEIYNPAENINPQHGAQMPAIPSLNAPPGWNDPPVIKNAARNQVCILWEEIMLIYNTNSVFRLSSVTSFKTSPIKLYKSFCNTIHHILI